MAALDPGKVVAELNELWASLEKTAGENAHGVVRACALTLMVFAEESDDPAAIGQTLALAMREHPHRAIVVRVRPQDGPHLEHRVLAQCWKRPGQRDQICCEQIEITAAAASLPDLGSTLVAMRAPDLPVVVWVRSPAVFCSQFALFNTLDADKLIADSDAATDPGTVLSHLVEIAPAPGDLAWTRITRWREITAQAFEHPPARDAASQIAEVRVFCGGERIPSAAFYLGGWVRAALDREVAIRFERVAGEPIEGIEFAGAAPDSFRLSVRREGRDITVTEAGGVRKCIGCAGRSDASLLIEELGIPGRDPVYDKALRIAAQLAGHERR